MFKTHHFLIAASAFALSACLGSSNGSSPSETPTNLRADTPVEGMPTEGSATYSGAINDIQGDGDMRFTGQMSMTANFAEGGGTLTNSSLTIAGAEGALSQDGEHTFTGNSYENLPLLGELAFEGETLTSDNANTLLVGGTFRGEGATGVSANLGGSVMTPEGAMDISGGRGVLSQN
ncbi:MAG: hypothetical protein EA338_11595 [Roseinatronobacter sp.]|nr:MAG: hypothetical protein EA338_11595 [Roseinatronobacter sp.]